MKIKCRGYKYRMYGTNPRVETALRIFDHNPVAGSMLHGKKGIKNVILAKYKSIIEDKTEKENRWDKRQRPESIMGICWGIESVRKKR